MRCRSQGSPGLNLSVRRAAQLGAIAAGALLILPPPASADVVRKGQGCVPGNCGKVVNWTARYRKTPGSARGVHFWFDVELKNPQPNDNIEFIVCAMLNVNKDKKCQDAFKMGIVNGRWTCTPAVHTCPAAGDPATCVGGGPGTICWYPNYHFGCREVALNAGNGFKKNVFDDAVELKLAFKEKDLVAPYLDFVMKAPNAGFNNCAAVFGANNKWLEPGDGAVPVPFGLGRRRRPGDVDGDCDVDLVDLLLMLASWGACPPPCPPYCPADITGPPDANGNPQRDCQVDVRDFLHLLASWGWTDGTSSWWVVTRGVPSTPSAGVGTGPTVLAEAAWNTGNWYTMGVMGNVYQCALRGAVTDAPAGSIVQFEFPPSTGGATVNYLVGGSGCLGDPVEVDIPYTVSDALMGDRDENTRLRVLDPSGVCPDYPSGEIIEFIGDVVALNDTFFPNGDPLYAAGALMHGIHVQFIGDQDMPFVEQQQLVQVDSRHYELSVRAGDITTMAIGASVSYQVDGVPMGNVSMPYDDPAVDGKSTLFKVLLGPIASCTNIDYRVFLVDDAENVSESKIFNFNCP